MNNHLLARLSKHDTSLTPREVVHLPERVQRQHKREDGDSEDIEEHPPDHVPLATQNEDQGLNSVDGDNHDERDRLDLLALHSNQVDQIDKLQNQGQRRRRRKGKSLHKQR